MALTRGRGRGSQVSRGRSSQTGPSVQRHVREIKGSPCMDRGFDTVSDLKCFGWEQPICRIYPQTVHWSGAHSSERKSGSRFYPALSPCAYVVPEPCPLDGSCFGSASFPKQFTRGAQCFQKPR